MKKVIAAACLLLSSNVFAADFTVKICRLQAQNNGKAYLQPCGDWQSKSGCPKNDWITWPADTTGGKNMYSSAMAAMIAEKPVTVRLNTGNCDSYDITQMIRVNK